MGCICTKEEDVKNSKRNQMTLSDLYIPVKNFTEIKSNIRNSFKHKEKSDLSNSTIQKSEHYSITNDYMTNTDGTVGENPLLITNARCNQKIDLGNLQNHDNLEVVDESNNYQDKLIHNSLKNNEIKSFLMNMEVKKEKNSSNNNLNEYNTNESKYFDNLSNNNKFSEMNSNKNSIIVKDSKQNGVSDFNIISGIEDVNVIINPVNLKSNISTLNCENVNKNENNVENLETFGVNKTSSKSEFNNTNEHRRQKARKTVKKNQIRLSLNNN